MMCGANSSVVSRADTLLLGEPQIEKLKPAFEKALSILNKMPVETELVREGEAARFSERFASAVEAHQNPQGNP